MYFVFLLFILLLSTLHLPCKYIKLCIINIASVQVRFRHMKGFTQILKRVFRISLRFFLKVNKDGINWRGAETFPSETPLWS